MKREIVKINKSAMQFVDANCFAAVKLAATEGAAPTLDMCVYSGGIIKDHWWWGDLAIDLQGMSFPKKKFPILEDHSTSLKIGFASKMSVDNNQLTVADATYLDTPCSQEFQKNSSAGFPYEASMYAKPTTIEQVGEGDTSEVNGYTFKGPGTIWRKSIFKEASVCTFGYDPNTRSVAMSEGEEELSLEYINKKSEAVKLTNEEDKKTMNKDQFKAENPTEYAALLAEVTGEIEVKFAAEKAELEVKLSDALSSNTKLSEENKGAEKRLLALEKADALREEEKISFTAKSIFTEKFSAAGLPERLFSKVQKLVSHESFIMDGKLDKEAFGVAVDAELKDWEPEEGSSSVHGFSTTTKIPGADDSVKLKEVDEVVTRMLGHVGQVVPAV